MPNAIRLRRLKLASQATVAAIGDPHEINDMRAWRLREPVSGRAYAVIRITTKSGLRGYGESGEVSDRDLAQAKQFIAGKPATATEVVRRQLASLPLLAAAVNVAMLDITGQIAKAPVYQVLGGPTRNKARAFTLLYGASEEELAGSMQRARAAGFRAFGVPLPPVQARNQGQAFVHHVRQRVEALRSAAGADADFVLDGAGSLTPGDAASVSTALERFHLLWFDEPCPISNLSAVRKLADENVTPLGFGRHIRTSGNFQDLLREDALDILRPSLALHGITQIRRMAALAETYYVAVAPYHDGGPIATAAALHLAASLPNFFIQQIPLPAAEEDRRMRAALTVTPVEVVKDGFAPLPASPGLGISVNEEALEKYKESTV
jgi:galactonate dehydratase